MNFYNEHDSKTAAWLRELIAQGHIAPGVVDERSIEDIAPKEIEGFTQCHFFAGIGGWPFALRLAGWPDSKPVWTGSCPCQPFSAAGKGKGAADERHLWPSFKWLIEQCRPSIIFGEQVASKDARSWIDGVQNDLEDVEYTFGAASLSASPFTEHDRQRFYWFANACGERGEGLEQANHFSKMRQRGARCQEDLRSIIASPFMGGASWSKPLLCLGDDGLPYRVAGCHGAGNAIVPQVAAEFIQASIEAINDTL